MTVDVSVVSSEMNSGEKRSICILLGMIRLLAGWLIIVNLPIRYTQPSSLIFLPLPPPPPPLPPPITGPYLIVGTSHKDVGSISGHRIYEMTRYELIPFMSSTLHLTQSQVTIATSTPPPALVTIIFLLFLSIFLSCSLKGKRQQSVCCHGPASVGHARFLLLLHLRSVSH